MDESFEELITTVRILANDHNYDRAIETYFAALEQAPGIEYQIDIYNGLAGLFQEQNKTRDAIVYYQKSLELYDTIMDSESESFLANKAGILNNIGALHMPHEPLSAVVYHQKALQIIENLFKKDEAIFLPYLVNTHYSIASNYHQAKDAYQSVKAFKKVVEISEKLKGDAFEKSRPMLASTYFQLGMIKGDQNKVEDARTYYHKSMHHYEKLVETYAHQFLPYLASVFNNLAVINRQNGYLTESKKYYQKTIEAYKSLIQIDENTFLPYYAASLNALANVYADSWTPEDDIYSGDRGFLPGFGILGTSLDDEVSDSNKKEKSDLIIAENYYGQSLDVYQKLADWEPESYTHYVAMILHNLGVLYDEKKEFKTAEKYYKQALVIRKNLAQKEPHSFDTDVCVTQMNLVTLYQTMMERAVDFSYKDVCLELLEDIRSRLGKYRVEELPQSIQNLLGDLEYFSVYFAEITEADLVATVLAEQSGRLNDEALSTLDLTKRLDYYSQILTLNFDAIGIFPGHDKLLKNLEYYFPQIISTAILNKQSNLAQEIIDKFTLLLPTNITIQSQNAILSLYRNNRKKAEEILQRIKEKNETEGKNIRNIVVEQAVELGIEFN